jgi:predicted metal-binding transcription factor (methanogenesis marker protein 9)
LLRNYDAEYTRQTYPDYVEQCGYSESFLHRLDSKVGVDEDLRLNGKAAEYIIVDSQPEKRELHLSFSIGVAQENEQRNVDNGTDDNRYPFIGDANMVFIDASRSRT